MLGQTFYSLKEISGLRLMFKHIGQDVKISRLATIINPDRLEIGDHSRIDDFCFLSGDIKIGRWCHVGNYVLINGNHGFQMDDFAGIAPRCSFFSETDDYMGNGIAGPCTGDKFRCLQKGSIHIEKYVSLATGVLILPGVVLKQGSVATPYSIVRSDLRPWMIHQGNPARPVAKRKRKVILDYAREIIAKR